MRCLLLDGKNSALNLSFCSEQEFNTQDEAKHSSALLVLFYFQPGLPLERKLPDPFRALWLSLSQQKDAESPDGVQLSTDRKYACKADAEQEKRKHEEIRSSKKREKERRNQKMPHKEVFMSVQCREMIEKVLKDLETDQHQSSECIKGFMEAEKTNSGDSELERKLMLDLASLGFKSDDINAAITYCRKSCNGLSHTEVASTARDWLFLNVKESDLPDTFNPFGTQLDVVAKSQHNSNNHLLENLSAFESALHQRIISYGCDINSAFALVEDFVEKNSAEDIRLLDPHANKEAVVSAVEEIWSCYFKLMLRTLEMDRLLPNIQDQQDEGVRQETIANELSALDSIYGEKISINSYTFSCKDANAALEQTSIRHCNYHIIIQSSEMVNVELFLPASNKYPDELPLLALRTTKPEYKRYLITALGELLQSVKSLLGGPILYDLAMNADSILDSLCSTGELPMIIAYKSNKDQVGAVSTSCGLQPQKADLQDRESLPSKQEDDRRKDKKRGKQALQPRTKRFVSYGMLRIEDDKKVRNPKLRSIQESRKTLPAARTKSQFLEYLDYNQVVMVSGQTGCGKSTQIPQFILENCIANRKDEGIEIVCTQPRRIAAVGVATRVAEERMESLGDIVGYQIRMESKRSDRTKLLFCTTGILFRRLMHDRMLENVRSY